MPVTAIVAGSFAPLPGYGDLTAVGKAMLVHGADNTTAVQIHLDGLLPSTDYNAHVHALPCASGAGGHYKLDPNQADGILTNEIWLHVSTDVKGSGDAAVTMPAAVRGDALSIVVHNPTDKSKMLCADLTNSAGLPIAASGKLAPFAAAEAIDQTIAGTAQLTRMPGSTIVQLTVSGLANINTYMAHVHTLPCAVMSAGGHYMIDPLLNPSTQANELWPTITVSAAGLSDSTMSQAQHVARADAQSVVVHRMAATLIKVACADLVPAKYVDLTAQGTGTALPTAVDRGMGSLLLTGSLVRELTGNTRVVLAATGLEPGSHYMAHVHARPCAVETGGGHYMVDPAGSAGSTNEIWLELEASTDGTGGATGTIPFLVRPDAQSIVIHDAVDNARLACVDLVAK